VTSGTRVAEEVSLVSRGNSENHIHMSKKIKQFWPGVRCFQAILHVLELAMFSANDILPCRSRETSRVSRGVG
jgi:hypothetical protein